MSGSVVSVNLAVVRPNPAPTRRSAKPSTQRMTGIDKRPVAGPIAVHPLGVGGDTVCDRRVHGGSDKAVYAYAAEDTAWWQHELQDELAFVLGPGSLGENLTTARVDVTEAVIGEQWRIGTATLQVCAPRIPCSTFAGFWGVSGLIKRFTQAARPGAYLRVLVAGDISPDDAIVVLERPAHGLTVRETFRAMTGDRTLVGKLLLARELPESLLADARAWAGQSA